MNDVYNPLCTAARGVSEVGSAHLWAFKGLVRAIMDADVSIVSQENKDWLRNECLRWAGGPGDEGQVMLRNDRMGGLDKLCTVCNVKATKGPCYVNLCFNRVYHDRLGAIVDAYMMSLRGRVQTGPAQMPPSMRAARDALASRGEWGKGRGKGKGGK